MYRYKGPHFEAINLRVSQKNMQNGLLYPLYPSNTIHIINYATRLCGTKNPQQQNGLPRETQNGKIPRSRMNRSIMLLNPINSTLKLKPSDNFLLMRLYTKGSNIYRRNWLLWYEIYRSGMIERRILVEGDRMGMVGGMMAGYRVP
jgi:hypothetical protein